MNAFTFSTEQLRSAPPEVRRWAANEIGRALGELAARPEPPHDAPRQAEAMTLAGCSVSEAARVFELIASDPVVVRLFFEMARETALNTGLPGLHAIRLADLLHHVGLAGPDNLIGGLAAIDRAFRQVHPEAPRGLFGFDQAGHVYVHEVTQASIRRVWEGLVQARDAAERDVAAESTPAFEGFVPPRVGPSENVAAHAARLVPGADMPL